ncbi:MAG: hypothetical protein OXN20_08925, partial [Gemmatimonadota bacterium]|nr:hypothetical protein [Gemmatimonadota bacterium]
MMRRQLRMFGLVFCMMGVLCTSYAEGHMLYSDESDVTDFNGDGKTDFDDFILFVAAFGSQQVPFDLNGNGLVDFPDFLIFVAQFAQTSPHETPDTLSVEAGYGRIVLPGTQVQLNATLNSSGAQIAWRQVGGIVAEIR